METKRRIKKEYVWKFVCPPNKFSSKEAAEFLGLPLYVIYTLRKKGILPCIESQSMYFFEKKDLLNWILQNHPEQGITQNLKKGNLFRVVQNYLNIMIMFLR